MEIIADLHIHSRYSMATSKLGTPEYLDLWARKKGISLVGTGDFTHPAWREELKEKLVPAESGLYRLRDEYVLEEAKMLPGGAPRFVITGEISSIYKKNGKCRKVHNVLLLSGLEEADKIAGRLEKIEIFIQTEGQYWDLIVTIFWKFYWKTVPMECWFRHISGLPTSDFLVPPQGLIPWKNVLKILLHMFMLWRRDYLQIHL